VVLEKLAYLLVAGARLIKGKCTLVAPPELQLDNLVGFVPLKGVFENDLLVVGRHVQATLLEVATEKTAFVKELRVLLLRNGLEVKINRRLRLV